jgi:FMN hydrolase / 5-amino-6-(5-phospho-D-ribitylamino)uracil phosphatase
MNKTSIKAILFDLDDTLWPIEPVIQRAEIALYDWLTAHTPQVAQQYTIEGLRTRRGILMAAEPRYRIDLWSLRHTVLTEAFLAVGEDPTKVELAMAVFSRARNTVTPFEDVLPTLKRLGNRAVLGSISNGFADLEEIGMAHHFQVSIAAHRMGCAKPDPAIFHAACDALKVSPAETVYVGDDPLLDVEGAQKAGLRGVWINRFERAIPDHVQPDAAFTSLYELAHWLDPWLKAHNGDNPLLR